MGASVANVNFKPGFDFSKYLSRQVIDVNQNMDLHNEYLMKGIKTSNGMPVDVDPFILFTRSSGILFDDLNLSGHLTQEKLNIISKLCTGEHELTKGFKKQRKTIYRSIVDADGDQVEVKLKDIKNGFYKDELGNKIKFDTSKVNESSNMGMKIGTEIVLTQDATFSFAIASMNEQDRYDAEQMLQDIAMEVYDNIFRDMLHDKYFNKGESGVFLFYHNDSRNPLTPSSHIHMVIPNVLKLPDGTIRSIEMPEMRDKNFHDMIDMQYKSRLVQRWSERFKNYPVEAYDKDHQKITSPNQEVKDFRVAYNEESLQKIRNQSVADELIKKYIKYQKDDLRNTVELKRQEIDKEIVEMHKKLNFSPKLTTGTLISYGEDNFQFDSKNSKSFYVKAMVKYPDGKEKEQIYWGADLKRAIESSKAKAGDLITIDKQKSNTGNSKAKVNWDIKVDSENMAILESIEELETKMARVNKKYSNKLAYMDTTKHRNQVWKVIKERKKGGSILTNAVDNADAVKNLLITLDDNPGIKYKQKTYEQILETLTETTPYITRNSLIYEISKASPVGFNAQKLADDIINKTLSNGVLEFTGTFSKTQMAYTTSELIKKEEQNVDLMVDLIKRKQNYKIHDIKKEIDLVEARPEYKEKGIVSNKEQVEMIEHVYDDNKAQLIVGLPGTGKSVTLSICAEIGKKHGFRIIATAFTNKVTGALAEETTCELVKTVDSLLLEIQSGKLKLNEKDIIFVDEASQIGTRKYNSLLNAVSDANAKIVLIGDPNQVNSVNTGSTLDEMLRNDEIRAKTVFLTDIRRQKNAVALEVAESSALKPVYKDAETFRAFKKSGEHIDTSVEILENHGLVHKYKTTTEAIDGISQGYIKDVNDYKNKVLIAPTNETIARINEIIQDYRIETGELIGNSYVNKDNLHFFKGDRIVLEKNNKKNYKNGDFGTILNIDENSKEITVEFDNRKIKTVPYPEKMKLAYGITPEKAQGLSTNNTKFFGEISQNLNQNSTNVIFTRARYETSIYCVESEYDALRAAMKRESGKESLIDIGKRVRALKAQNELKNQPVKETIEPTLNTVQTETLKVNKLTEELLKNGLSNIKDNSLRERLEKFRKIEHKQDNQLFIYQSYMKPMKKPPQEMINQIVNNHGEILKVNENKVMNVNDLKINSVKPIDNKLTIEPVNSIVKPSDIYKIKTQKMSMKKI